MEINNSSTMFSSGNSSSRSGRISVSVECSPRQYPLSSVAVAVAVVGGDDGDGGGDGDGDGDSVVMGMGMGVGMGVGMGCVVPFKKRIQNPHRSTMLGRELADAEEEEEEAYANIEAGHAMEYAAAAAGESVSPRVSYPNVARRLDFYSSGEWSPIQSLVPASVAAESVAAESVAAWENAQPFEVTKKPEEDSGVGDCSICYDPLPLRSNHIFTVCGHLFCVKCLLTWWDSSSICPMCRAEIIEFAAVVPALDGMSASSYHREIEFNDLDGTWRIHGEWMSIDRLGGNADDDNVGGRSVSPPRPIATIDRYLHIDADVNWSSSLEETNPSHDDSAVVLTRYECINLRSSRELVSMLWARQRFRETLLSNVNFLGETYHTFIQKQNWLGLSRFDLGPDRMFEFVMCRTNFHNRGHETNFFGYISSVVVIEAENPLELPSYGDEYTQWENSNEYAFVVNVFTLSSDAPYGSYNIDEGTFETDELMFRFADIRRMYSIRSREMFDV